MPIFSALPNYRLSGSQNLTLLIDRLLIHLGFCRFAPYKPYLLAWKATSFLEEFPAPLYHRSTMSVSTISCLVAMIRFIPLRRQRTVCLTKRSKRWTEFGRVCRCYRWGAPQSLRCGITFLLCEQQRKRQSLSKYVLDINQHISWRAAIDTG